MSRACLVRRNKKRLKKYKSCKAKRAAARIVNKDPNASFEEKMDAQKYLQESKEGCGARLRNRCKLTGRPRGVYRKFGLCRNMLRILAMKGDVPGLVKSSW